MKIIKNSKKGMEIVQVAILIAIAIALGIDNAACDTCRNVTFLYTDKPL